MFGGGGNAEQGRNNSKNRMFLLVPVAVAGFGLLLVIVGVASGTWLTLTFENEDSMFAKAMKENPPVIGLSNDRGDKHKNQMWCTEIEGEGLNAKRVGCGFLGTVTAMCVLGILAAAAGILLALGHVALGKTALMPAAGGAACLLAGLFTLIGVIIFATQSSKFREDNSVNSEMTGVALVLGWSFALTTVGGVLFLAAGALMLVIVLVCK